MSTFTDAEIEFLNSQRLGRLATVGADGMPHVVPVAVFYDPEAEALVIGANAQFGEEVMVTSKKFRDVQRRPRWPSCLMPRHRASSKSAERRKLTSKAARMSASDWVPRSGSARHGSASGPAASWPWGLTTGSPARPRGRRGIVRADEIRAQVTSSLLPAGTSPRQGGDATVAIEFGSLAVAR